MPGHVILIWDYDAAMGQVNATYPYNFHEETIYSEIENVEGILALGSEFDVRMTFACTGFGWPRKTYTFGRAPASGEAAQSL